jgi:two-component system, cell cycle response regulator
MISEQEIHNAGILIVDDRQSNVFLLGEMLRDAGYARIASTNYPNTVCALHQKDRYDLILLDLQMPGMDGFQVMDGLKAIETDSCLPVLVISAQRGHRQQALAAGAKDFICKPFDLMEAKTRIHNMLEMRLLYKQLEHSSRELETLALHDALTGLPNRRLLLDRLALAIAHARRNKGTTAVMYLALDGLRQVNDTLGHAAGDTLLGTVAARMVAAVRQEDTVARLGGDEFAIALCELRNAGDVGELASKVIQAVSQPYSILGRSVSICASVGVGIFPAHGAEPEALLRSADLALYEAKRTGKNLYRIASGADPLALARS